MWPLDYFRKKKKMSGGQGEVVFFTSKAGGGELKYFFDLQGGIEVFFQVANQRSGHLICQGGEG